MPAWASQPKEHPDLCQDATVTEDQVQPGEGSAQVSSLAKELELLSTERPPTEIPRPGLAGQLETPAMDASYGDRLSLDRATATPPDPALPLAEATITGEPPEDDQENPPALAVQPGLSREDPGRKPGAGTPRQPGRYPAGCRPRVLLPGPHPRRCQTSVPLHSGIQRRRRRIKRPRRR